MNDAVMLNVPQILQNPSLPNGCEITSCAEVLHFLGFAADKDLLADRYLPRSAHWRGADPDRVYMGDPHRDDDSPACGFYCFAGPVIAAADRYLAEQGSALRGHDLTGCGQAELEAQLRAGRPVIFWATLHFEDVEHEPQRAYSLPDGRVHVPFHKLHCMVLKGMDDTFFYLADPLDNNSRVSKERFLQVFEQLGRRALVIA